MNPVDRGGRPIATGTTTPIIKGGETTLARWIPWMRPNYRYFCTRRRPIQPELPGVAFRTAWTGRARPSIGLAAMDEFQGARRKLSAPAVSCGRPARFSAPDRSAPAFGAWCSNGPSASPSSLPMNGGGQHHGPTRCSPTTRASSGQHVALTIDFQARSGAIHAHGTCRLNQWRASA